MYKFTQHWIHKDYRHLLADLAYWLPIAALVGVLAGSASAALLASLEWATATREAHRWIIALLPLAGLLVGLLYHFGGKAVESGNNLILDEIHNPSKLIQARMAFLILLGTVITHLFGGSAGREGTAIQMGASLADQLTQLFRFSPENRRILLMSGISGGFSSVFGTPLAGAVFGMEVLAFGRIEYQAILPCFVAAFAGDYITRLWGIQHTLYRVTNVSSLTPIAMLSAMAAGIVFGLVGMLFAEATHTVSRFSKRYIRWAPAQPFAGGVIVAAAVFMLGTTRYIGLGIPTIVASFSAELPPYTFAVKLLFTVVTLGSGFKGGEVTPLFYIGATLGNALSSILPLSPSLLAGMGFVAVFAGAANTPLSSSLMAIELFGPEAGSFAALACVLSYLFSGHSGIYRSQRVGRSKHSALVYQEGNAIGNIGTSMAVEPGLPTAIKEMTGSQLTVLRLYFCASRTLPRNKWWRRIAPQSLGIHLLKRAKAIGIEQALLHRILGGYLKNQVLALEGSREIPAFKLPQCLELVGEEELLRRFLDENRSHMQHVLVVFLRGEEAGAEAAIEEDGIKESLRLEGKEAPSKNAPDSR